MLCHIFGCALCKCFYSSSFCTVYAYRQRFNLVYGVQTGRKELLLALNWYLIANIASNMPDSYKIVIVKTFCHCSKTSVFKLFTTKMENKCLLLRLLWSENGEVSISVVAFFGQIVYLFGFGNEVIQKINNFRTGNLS